MERFVRYSIAVVVAGGILLWAIRPQPITVVIEELGSSPATGNEAATAADPVDEIDVPWARRSATLDACPDPDEDKTEEELQAEYEAQLAEYNAQREQMLLVLEGSEDVEHLMVAALVSWRDDADGALLLLGEAAARDPDNAMVASQVLDLCLEIGHCSRARPEMEQNLIAADKGNVVAWVQIARSRLKRDDEQGALAAMREAAAAAEVQDYFTQYVMVFERALAASSDLPAHERLASAFGFSAAVFSGAYVISSDCRARAATSAEWADVCIRVGERLENDGRTVLTTAIGIGIQASMYELLEDWREHERTMNRQQAFRDRYQPLIQKSAQAEKLEDATAFRRYLEIFDTGGELEAMQYLADEVESRLPAAAQAQQQACQTP